MRLSGFLSPLFPYSMKIVLFNPEIPQNTGNVIRTCSVTETPLVLVEPLGFSLSNRQLKRAGMDYFEGVNVEIIPSLEDYLVNQNSFYFFSSKASKSYHEVEYKEGDLLIFGSESKGLPDHFHEKYPERFLKVPMKPGKRCLNLATTVGIALFEALRQMNFKEF